MGTIIGRTRKDRSRAFTARIVIPSVSMPSLLPPKVKPTVWG